MKRIPGIILFQVFTALAAGPGEHVIRPPGNQVHAFGKGIQRGVNRQAHAGKDRRTQCDSQNDDQSPHGVQPHVPQAEPAVEPQEKEKGSHV